MYVTHVVPRCSRFASLYSKSHPPGLHKCNIPFRNTAAVSNRHDHYVRLESSSVHFSTSARRLSWLLAFDHLLKLFCTLPRTQKKNLHFERALPPSKARRAQSLYGAARAAAVWCGASDTRIQNVARMKSVAA